MAKFRWENLPRLRQVVAGEENIQVVQVEGGDDNILIGDIALLLINQLMIAMVKDNISI